MKPWSRKRLSAFRESSEEISVMKTAQEIDLVLAVEGCATACADLSPFERKRISEISCPEDVEKFVQEAFQIV